MEKSEAYPWQLLLSSRQSKFDVESYAQTLHHDEQGISLLVETLLTTKVERVALNTAWILSHLRKEDKEIYLASSYDKLTDFAMQPHLTIRRGLVLPISLDISIGKHQDRYIEFLFEGNAQ